MVLWDSFHLLCYFLFPKGKTYLYKVELKIFIITVCYSKTARVYIKTDYWLNMLQSIYILRMKHPFFSFQFFVKPFVITLFSEKHMPTVTSVVMYY